MKHSAILLLVILVTAAATLVLGSRDAASEDPKVETRYLSVTGDGPTARAWYDGSPPSGVQLQEALDKFNGEGFRVARITDPYVGTSGSVVWGLLMERRRK